MLVQLRRLLGAAVAFTLVIAGLTVLGGTAEAAAGSSFAALMNSSRSAAGLAPYAVRSDLTAVAQGQAQRMAASGKLYHNPNLATAVKNFSWVGENVGSGPSVTSLHDAFMASPSHRANILDRQFTEVGVGRVQVGSTIWVSEVFRRPSGAVTATPRPKPVTKPKTGIRYTSHRAIVSRPRVNTAPHSAAMTPARAVPVRPPVVPRLPDHVVCSAAPAVAAQIRALAGSDRSARLLQQTQHLLLGYQCGAHLPLTGAFDLSTLKSLAG